MFSVGSSVLLDSGGLSNLGAPVVEVCLVTLRAFFAFRWRHHVRSTVVRPFCKIGKIGSKIFYSVYFEGHDLNDLAMPMV